VLASDSGQEVSQEPIIVQTNYAHNSLVSLASPTLEVSSSFNVVGESRGHLQHCDFFNTEGGCWSVLEVGSISGRPEATLAADWDLGWR
jgi:hypothetical protein